jgi:hypothetical protein
MSLRIFSLERRLSRPDGFPNQRRRDERYHNEDCGLVHTSGDATRVEAKTFWSSAIIASYECVNRLPLFAGNQKVGR